METFKSYLVLPKLPKLRFPTIAQLKDGSFLNPRVEQLESEESWLKEFEVSYSEIERFLNYGQMIFRASWSLLKRLLSGPTLTRAWLGW